MLALTRRLRYRQRLWVQAVGLDKGLMFSLAVRSEVVHVVALVGGRMSHLRSSEYTTIGRTSITHTVALERVLTACHWKY